MGEINIGLAVTQLLVFLFAITVHEASHALTADLCGDPTAKRLGRISLNPIVHIDLFGTILFPLMLSLSGGPAIGWAKPVPFNPLNLKKPKLQAALIAAAGPGSNMILALLAAGAFQAFGMLHGSLPDGAVQPVFYLVFLGCVINVYLAVFNLLPIYPLDGSTVLNGLLSDEMSAKFMELQRYGFLLLAVFVFTGASDVVLRPTTGVILSILGVTR